ARHRALPRALRDRCDAVRAGGARPRGPQGGRAGQALAARHAPHGRRGRGTHGRRLRRGGGPGRAHRAHAARQGPDARAAPGRARPLRRAAAGADVSLRDPSHVVMIGTDSTSRGGIAAVIASWRSAGLFERWPIEYLATHREGTRREKISTAAQALLALFASAWRNVRGVLHVHAASRWSFWRKSIYMSAALMAGWQVIFHLHGGGFARFLREDCGPLGRRVVRYFLDRAAVIVVVSERWA